MDGSWPSRRSGRDEWRVAGQNLPIPTTRFAPSPTGLLHIGHAYSAWFAAERGRGQYLLRIEDIDGTRSRDEFRRAIEEDLSWLGLPWRGPVRIQSKHLDEYAASLAALTAEGLTYRCFCTRAEIAEEARRSQEAPQGPEGPVYPGTCRSLSVAEADELAGSKPFAIRLDMAAAVARVGPVEWHDETIGERKARPELFGDIVLARKETPASYHLCVVHDDAAQGIELVTRGRDLVDATDVHVLLQRLLGRPTPAYAHHRLVLDDAGERMAKRAASTTVRSLREAGRNPQDVLAEATRRLEPG